MQNIFFFCFCMVKLKKEDDDKIGKTLQTFVIFGWIDRLHIEKCKCLTCSGKLNSEKIMSANNNTAFKINYFDKNFKI